MTQPWHWLWDSGTHLAMLPLLWDCLRCPELTHHCLTSLLTSPDTGNHPQPVEPFLLGASLSWEFMWHQPTAPALPSQGGTATPQLLFTASSTPCPFFVLILEYSHTMQAPSTPAISTTDHFLHIASLNYSAFILNSFSRYLLALKHYFQNKGITADKLGIRTHILNFSLQSLGCCMLKELEEPWETTQLAHVPLVEHVP